jgi:hypothetical protein
MFLAEQVVMPEVDKFRYWFEIAYFASGVIIAFIGIIALWQLKLAKQNIKVASEILKTTKTDLQLRIKREATIIAAQQAEKFAEQIVPSFQKNLSLISSMNLPGRRWVLEDNRFDENTIIEWNEAGQWARNIQSNEEVRREVVSHLNKLESFAIYFAKGAADEQIIFPAIGNSFCGQIDIYVPYLILLRTQKIEESSIATGPYQNIINLYEIWSTRLKRETLVKEADLHKSEADKSRRQAEDIKVSSIRPIGADE